MAKLQPHFVDQKQVDVQICRVGAKNALPEDQNHEATAAICVSKTGLCKFVVWDQFWYVIFP